MTPVLPSCRRISTPPAPLALSLMTTHTSPQPRVPMSLHRSPGFNGCPCVCVVSRKLLPERLMTLVSFSQFSNLSNHFLESRISWPTENSTTVTTLSIMTLGTTAGNIMRYLVVLNIRVFKVHPARSEVSNFLNLLRTSGSIGVILLESELQVFEVDCHNSSCDSGSSGRLSAIRRACSAAWLKAVIRTKAFCSMR